MKQHKASRLAFVALVGLGGAVSAPTAVIAGPADVIYSPIVDYREWELELKGGMFDWGHGDEGERAAKLSLGYGIAPRWKTELVVEYSQAPGSAARLEEYELENIFQLTEHGEHWLDAGIFAEFAHNRLENTNSLVIGPMFQKEMHRSQLNLNLFLDRRLSALPRGETDSARNEVKYQAQWKYNLRSTFEPGVQVFGSLGDPAHLRSDTLSAGPAIFGVASLGNAKKLRYNAAILAGLTRGTPDTTLRFQLEYEFF